MSEVTSTPAGQVAGIRQDEATAAFSTSVVVSGIRCLFAYVIFPWLLPALGIAGDWGPWLGLVIGPVAIVFNVLSIRRFHRSHHRWRWPITAINVTIIGLLLVLTYQDLSTIVS